MILVGELTYVRRRSTQISALAAHLRPRRKAGSREALREEARRIDVALLVAARRRPDTRTGRTPRTASRRCAGGQPEVFQDPAGDLGIFDRRDEAHRAAGPV